MIYPFVYLRPTWLHSKMTQWLSEHFYKWTIDKLNSKLIRDIIEEIISFICLILSWIICVVISVGAFLLLMGLINYIFTGNFKPF